MKKLNKKGLTLIELLVVIVIIVIISLMIIPSVINMLGKNKNEKYKNYENLLVENMKLYRIDNSENLGDNIDTHLSLNILKSANPDIKLDNCAVHDLHIKNSDYNVCLRCGYDEETKKYEYESKYCETANVPYGNPPTTTTLVKEVKTEPSSGYLNDGKEIKVEVVLSRQVTGSYPTLTILAGNNNKTLTGVLEGNKLVYNYTVKNGDNGKFNAVSLNGGSLKDIENNEEVNLELPVISSSITLDTIEPTCNITLTNKRIEQTQEKVDLKITGTDINLAENAYSFDNNTYSNAYIKSLTDDGNYKAYVKDKANNIGYCSKLVYIDRENPTITTNIEKQNGSVKVKTTLKDNEGVIAYQEGTNSSYNSNWVTFDSIKEKEITLTKTNVGTYYIYAKDEYGHITKVSYEVKASDLDSEKPILTVVDKTCLGTSCNVKIKMTDNIGIVSYNDGSSWINVNPAVKEKEIVLTKTSIGTYKVQAKDNVGNVGEVTFEILNSDFDTTPPVMVFSINEEKTVAIVSCTDPESGIATEATKTQNLTGTSNVDVTFSCTNNAGLTTSETRTYKYSQCATGENTCSYGCGSCYDSCASTETVSNGCRTCTCYDYEPVYTCTQYCNNCGGHACGLGSNCVNCKTDYKKKYYQCSYCNVCGENTTTQCVGGYVSCNCSSCYNGHNTCKAGWSL